jgi:hypothetical protein
LPSSVLPPSSTCLPTPRLAPSFQSPCQASPPCLPTISLCFPFLFLLPCSYDLDASLPCLYHDARSPQLDNRPDTPPSLAISTHRLSHKTPCQPTPPP